MKTCQTSYSRYFLYVMIVNITVNTMLILFIFVFVYYLVLKLFLLSFLEKFEANCSSKILYLIFEKPVLDF
ncbi:hypothetical protein T12_13095 [Trichinella patagoniensis]|uniref:Uncharacterized protein n=1 Tax=Trichinella patagoniensis TaxID=990121 RepID=A0A0V1A016_9BILA|nr:hypothetical protein T12_13095 [Trichinella patagoniensis]